MLLHNFYIVDDLWCMKPVPNTYLNSTEPILSRHMLHTRPISFQIRISKPLAFRIVRYKNVHLRAQVLTILKVVSMEAVGYILFLINNFLVVLYGHGTLSAMLININKNYE